ncbi:MAG: hypothetical protein MO852_14145 [Candidatus Devosia euplotis]|nr:hypothetical protein [Candidatus Devosia euplotis]
MKARILCVMPSGIVIYTQDSLQQQIGISIFRDEPEHQLTEPMSGRLWTHVETAEARFPSRRFFLSSPSTPAPLPNGPIFLADSVPVEPDVIEIAMRPRRCDGHCAGTRRHVH